MLGQDIRYALRQFRRAPGFFLTATLLIAAGIAVNTQIFAIVDAFLLRPLPVRDPQSLVQLFEIRQRLPPGPYFDYPFCQMLASRSTTLAGVNCGIELVISLEKDQSAERVHPRGVTERYFDDLGVRPVLGRVLRPGDRHAAVLSYGYWNRGFGRDAGALGRSIRLKGRPYTIVGVTGEEFSGTTVDSGPDLWIPLSGIPEFSTAPKPNLNDYVVDIVGRLRPGVSLSRAQQETAALFLRYYAGHYTPEQLARSAFRMGSDNRLELRSIAHGLSPIRDQSGDALLLLLGGTLLLLLMVCANVGGLLLARATDREKETAVRLAIGATRGRIVRQWLTASAMLAAAGVACGIFLAYATLPLLMRLMPPAHSTGIDTAELRPLTLNVHPDARVAAFSIAVFLVTIALSTWAPAWRSSRYDLSLALKAAMSDSGRLRFQSLLCGFQIALCAVILVTAALTLRSLSNLRNSNIGFQPDRVAVFSLDPHVRGYDGPRTWALEQRLLKSAVALPGVENAAIATRALMRGVGLVNAVVLPGERGAGLANASMNYVTPGYFQVMGISFLSGRNFQEGELEEKGKPRKVVVNAAFARRFFDGRSPLGHRFGTGRQYADPVFEIIGVVNDTKYRSLREVPPPIFYEYGFGPATYSDTFILHIRTGNDPQAMINPVRELVASIDPGLPLFQEGTLSGEVSRSLWQDRLLVWLTGCYGAFAAALSTIGLYGILSYFVSRRQREIGLRVALGARFSQVIGMVIGKAIPTLAGGILAGAILSWFAAVAVRSQLYGVEPFDPWASGAVLFLLLAIGLAGVLVPALRAIRLDPASALRME